MDEKKSISIIGQQNRVTARYHSNHALFNHHSFVFHFWSFHEIATTLISLSLASLARTRSIPIYVSFFSCFCECYWIRFWLCDATMHLLSNHFHIQSTDTLTSYKRDTSSNPLEQQTAVQINSASRVWIKPMKKHADDTHTHCSLRNIHK